MSAMMPVAAASTAVAAVAIRNFPRHVDDIYEEFTAAVFFFFLLCVVDACDTHNTHFRLEISSKFIK